MKLRTFTAIITILLMSGSAFAQSKKKLKQKIRQLEAQVEQFEAEWHMFAAQVAERDVELMAQAEHIETLETLYGQLRQQQPVCLPCDQRYGTQIESLQAEVQACETQTDAHLAEIAAQEAWIEGQAERIRTQAADLERCNELTRSSYTDDNGGRP